jgi:hypothetical protein
MIRFQSNVTKIATTVTPTDAITCADPEHVEGATPPALLHSPGEHAANCKMSELPPTSNPLRKRTKSLPVTHL